VNILSSDRAMHVTGRLLAIGGGFTAGYAICHPIRSAQTEVD
jgi:hypothetical protein